MNIIKTISEKIKAHDMKESMERVNEDYQIAERDGQLWLTFWGHPFIPQSMIKGDIVEALKEIRKMHVNDRNG